MTDTTELLQRAHEGDREAAGEYLRQNSALIWSIVKRYMGRGTEAEDLYQLGCVGFLKAVDGYDAAFGTCFSTYAVPKIAGEIRRFLRDDGAVKVSRGLKERSAHVAKVREQLRERLNREPYLSEVAVECGLSVSEVAEADCAASPVESYQQEYGDSGVTLEALLGDEEAEERTLSSLSLRLGLDRLPDKQRQVIALRYYHGLTQQRCADILRVSQVQISRLERKALAALRDYLEEP